MKRKKLFSMAVAGMLVVAQMVMPVSAEDGGNVPVTVTTRTAVLRVEVPTTFAIAVNQFEKGDAGSQIYSGLFDLRNKSEVPVKMVVKSKANLNATADEKITLLPTKAGVGTATTASAPKGAAWLAVAAKTGASQWGWDSAKEVKALDDTDKSVATLTAADGAAQTFYLAGPDAGAYKAFTPESSTTNQSATSLANAEFYPLTATTFADQSALDTALTTKDVYMVNEASIVANNVNGKTLVLVAKKGGAASLISSGVSYFTAETFDITKKVANASLTASTPYVYSTVAYKVIKTDATGKTTVPYAQLYGFIEITEVTASAAIPGVDSSTNLYTSDIYKVAYSSGSKKADPDATDFVLVARAGQKAVDAEGTIANTYYKVDTLKADTPGNSTCYMYGESIEATSTNGVAAFRYIGKLSGNGKMWKDTDIGTFTINYTIEGVLESDFNTVQTGSDWKYGLYTGTGSGAAASSGEPTIAATATYSKANGVAITMNYGTGANAATGITSVSASNSSDGSNPSALVLNTNYTVATGTLTLKSGMWAGAAVGAKKYLVVKFTGSQQKTATVEVTIAN